MASAAPAAADTTVAAAAGAGAAALLQAAATQLAPPAARIEVLPGQLDPRLQLTPCGRVEPFLPAGSPAWGRTRVGLRCLEGTRAWTVYLPVTVKVLAPAIVSIAALPAGTVLRAEHLGVAEVDWAASTSPALAAPGPALGRTLARALAPGEALRQTDLQVRRWFAAGDTVRIVAVGPGFSVTGEGQALGDGLEGRLVRVRTESGRVVSGRPTGGQRVEVAL